MKPEEFTHYVESQLKDGIPRHILIDNLKVSGWPQEQIDRALADHDKVMRKELAPTHQRLYTIPEMFLWLIFVLLIMVTILFYLGGE